jgi:hypothetical protein
MRRAHAEAQYILIEERIVRLARPGPLGGVEQGGYSHENLNQLRVGGSAAQHTVGTIAPTRYA